MSKYIAFWGWTNSQPKDSPEEAARSVPDGSKYYIEEYPDNVYLDSHYNLPSVAPVGIVERLGVGGSHKLTPGPWKFREIEMDGRVIGVSLETLSRPVRSNDPVIFAIREDWIRTFGAYGKGHYHADHRLIEAAPDMLDALVKVEAHLMLYQGPDPAVHAAALKHVRSVLDKARLPESE